MPQTKTNWRVKTFFTSLSLNHIWYQSASCSNRWIVEVKKAFNWLLSDWFPLLIRLFVYKSTLIFVKVLFLSVHTIILCLFISRSKSLGSSWHLSWKASSFISLWARSTSSTTIFYRRCWNAFQSFASWRSSSSWGSSSRANIAIINWLCSDWFSRALATLFSTIRKKIFFNMGC